MSVALIVLGALLQATGFGLVFVDLEKTRRAVRVSAAGESEVSGTLAFERPNERLEERVQRLENEIENEREARRRAMRDLERWLEAGFSERIRASEKGQADQIRRLRDLVAQPPRLVE